MFPTRLLTAGDPFPAVTLPAVGGGTLTLPDDLAGGFGIVLVYRGAWCPYCSTQLSAFSRSVEALAEVGARVVALSVDDEPTTATLVAERHLAFPIGYGADADAFSAVTGAVVNPEPHHLQSTGFVLGPDGAVLTSVYATGAIGRLVPQDVIAMLRYLGSSSTG